MILQASSYWPRYDDGGDVHPVRGHKVYSEAGYPEAGGVLPGVTNVSNTEDFWVP